MAKKLAIIGTFVAVLALVMASDIIRFTTIYQSEDRTIQDGVTVWARGPVISGTVNVAYSYYEMVIDLDPVGVWRLGEAIGPTVIDAVGGNNGTYTDTVLGVAGAIPYDEDTAIETTGTSYIEIPHHDNYLLANGTVVLSFNSAVVSDSALFSKDSNGFDTGGHLTISTLNDKRIRVRLRSVDTSHEIFSEPIGDNSGWIHVAFSFGSGGMKLHVNGDLVATNPYTGGTIGNQEPIAIGASTAGSGDRTIHPLSSFFTGFIDEVSIFSNALTDVQIMWLNHALRFARSIPKSMVLVIKDDLGNPIKYIISNPDGAFRAEVEPGFTGSIEPLDSWLRSGEDPIVFDIPDHTEILLKGRIMQDDEFGDSHPMANTVVEFRNLDNSVFGYAISDQAGKYEIMTPDGFQGSGNVLGTLPQEWQP